MRNFQESAKGEKLITISCDREGCSRRDTFPLSTDINNWAVTARLKGWYISKRVELCAAHATHVKD